ncbi:unnamed protein product, partial [Protopolystoma xenopodis]
MRFTAKLLLAPIAHSSSDYFMLSAAESECAARRAAEAASTIAAATAAAQLARRAAEMADRLTGISSLPGSPGPLDSVDNGQANASAFLDSDGITTLTPAGTANQPRILVQEDEVEVGTIEKASTTATEQDEVAIGMREPDTTDASVALLLARVREMAERARAAEAMAKDAMDQLDAEQCFRKLYK